MRKKTYNEEVWLYPVLSKLGVTGLEANLSGGGDSGSIDDVTFFKGDASEYVQQKNEQDSVEAEAGVNITKFHVSPGTFVEAGDPLFETALNEARGSDGKNTEVRAEKDGFVTWTNPGLIGSELEEAQEAIRIAPLSEIELILSHMTIDDGTKADHTFWTALEEMIEREAVSIGNFYDNEGGSVWLKYALNPEKAEIEVEESSFVENEPEYDDEDEEWDPFAEDEEEDHDDIEP
jgi:hypothetical protein